MQTLEPAFEQLIRIQVMGSYQIVSSDDWRIALHKHAGYVSERKALLQRATGDPENRRAACREKLQQAGLSQKNAAMYCQAALSALELYGLERATRVLAELLEEDVLPHVAVSIVRAALDDGPASPESVELLDWAEIALHVCRHKKKAGQALKNSAGLIVKLIKDPETRSRVVSPETEASLKNAYRRQLELSQRQDRENCERASVLEYEQSRLAMAETLFQDMPEVKKVLLRKQKAEALRQQERFQRISPDVQGREIDAALIQDLARKEGPSYEKWRLRKEARQAVLSFTEPDVPRQGIA
jgi:hypothetical protein